MEDMSIEVSETNEGESERQWARRKLLEAASEGQGVTFQLMIGSTPVENGMNIEAVRGEFFELLDQGLIELDSNFQPRLSEMGVAELAE